MRTALNALLAAGANVLDNDGDTIFPDGDSSNRTGFLT
jgi:hypothetical protein